LAGPLVQAQWYDPTSGEYTNVHGSPLRNSGRRRFIVPGKNSEGDHDWVLVLKTTKAGTK
jgi:Putative collagen-binding domain of a collagenase